jgi:hypothetical protein
MMGITKHNTKGFSAVEIAFVLVVITGLCLSGYLLLSNSHKPKRPSETTNSATSTNTTTNSSNGAYAVLSPASVPSKTAECNQAISFSSNGDSGPITCSDGELNATEWNSLAALEPSVMNLCYGATSAQIQSSLCADVRANISNPIEVTTYQITALYYGWNFNPSPTSVITNGTCVNTDD